MIQLITTEKEQMKLLPLREQKNHRPTKRPRPESVVQSLSSLGFLQNPIAPLSTQFIANGKGIAEQFFRCRESFRNMNKPIHVKVGFHYTWSEAVGNHYIVENIQRRGLLSPTGGKGKITSQNGTFYGPGIYLSENPHAFSCYGDIGILVLYIAGEQFGGSRNKSGRRTVDSFRGNKLTRDSRNQKSPYFDEIIVQESEQILPVFAFARSETNNADQLHQFHAQVQELVDRTINYMEDYASGNNDTNFIPRRTTVPRIFPNYEDLNFKHKLYVQERRRISVLIDDTVIEKRPNISGAVIEEILDQPERQTRTFAWPMHFFSIYREVLLHTGFLLLCLVYEDHTYLASIVFKMNLLLG